MSVKATEWAWSVELAGTRKLVLLALADHADQEGICWPSMPKIGARAGCSARYARKCIVELEEAGLVRREMRSDAAGRQTSSVYRLVLEGTRNHSSAPPEQEDRGPGTRGPGDPEQEDRGTRNPSSGSIDESSDEPSDESPPRKPPHAAGGRRRRRRRGWDTDALGPYDDRRDHPLDPALVEWGKKQAERELEERRAASGA